MIFAINIIVSTLLSLLTLSTFSNLRILGVTPMLALFFVICFSYYRKGVEPILHAAFLGIFFEMFSAYPFGLYLFLFLLAGIIVRFMFQEGLRSFSFVYFVIITLALLVLFYGAQVVILLAEGNAIGLNYIWPIMAGLGVNLICAILIYAFSGWYFEKIGDLENVLKRR